MIHYYKNCEVYLKFDEQTLIYEAIKVDGNYVSYLKNIITDEYKNILISGFSKRGDFPSTEDEFNTVKEKVLLKLNN